MVDNEYYWRDFVKEVQIQLNSLIKQLHLAYERRNDCIYNIKDNLVKYQEAGVDVSVVFDIDNRSKIYFNKKQDALLGTKLMSYIRSYNYLVYERLDKLDDDIETLAALKELPSEIYTYMQDEVNNEIANLLCKGNNYSFGSSVGYVYVYYKKTMPGDVCSVVDWGATKDLKKKLLEQGINIRTADNPNGIPYFIYYDYDWCIKAVYHKVKGRIPQSVYYKFKFGHTSSAYENGEKTIDRTPFAMKGKTVDEIATNRRLNCFNKILAICFNHPDEAIKLYRNNLPKQNNAL